MKKYLFNYNTESCGTIVWFDGEYVGSTNDLSNLLTSMYALRFRCL